MKSGGGVAYVLLAIEARPPGFYLDENIVYRDDDGTWIPGDSGGGGFTASPMGDKALIATIDDGSRTYFFCGGCGDNISGRLESDEARRHYVWDWAIPLRNGHQPQS